MDSQNTENIEQVVTDNKETEVEKSSQDSVKTEFVSLEDLDTTPVTKEEDKIVQKEKTANGIVSSYEQKVINGDITMDEVPEWVQKEFQGNEAPKVNLEVKIKDDIRFEKQYDALKEMELSPSQKDDVITEFKDLVASGLTRAKAITKAMKIAGIYQSVEQARLKGAKMARMSMSPSDKTPPRSHNNGEITMETMSELSGKDFDAAWDKMVKNN